MGDPNRPDATLAADLRAFMARLERLAGAVEAGRPAPQLPAPCPEPPTFLAEILERPHRLRDETAALRFRELIDWLCAIWCWERGRADRCPALARHPNLTERLSSDRRT